MSQFDYSSIPLGYYDRIVRGENGVRKLWHVSKFERVLDVLPARGDALLDVGCFAGTFLSMVPEARFPRQLGIDILPEQIDYAAAHHGAPFRAFYTGSTPSLLERGERFDAMTAIELIEHLEAPAIAALLRDAHALLTPGGCLVLTTPNYGSAWPVLERVIDRLSDVTYIEQHVTRFCYGRFEAQLAALWPPVWQRFRCAVKTTTHFLTPFLAALSYDAARSMSRWVPHRAWRHPFGNLVFAVLERRAD